MTSDRRQRIEFMARNWPEVKKLSSGALIRRLIDEGLYSPKTSRANINAQLLKLRIRAARRYATHYQVLNNAEICGSSLRDSQECLVEDENQFHALILKKCIKHECLPSYLAFPFKDHLQVSFYLYYRNDPFPAFNPKHAPGKWIPVIFGGSNIAMGFDDELEVINA